MSHKEFLKLWLNAQRENLGIDSALHEYHRDSETHFLKLTPNIVVDAEENQFLLSSLILEFEDMFPREMLCIIGETSLTKLDNPESLI